MRSRLSTVLALLLSVPGVSPLAAQGGVEASGAYTGPIIDMHLHAYGDAEFPARPAPNPTTRQPSVRTAGEHMERSLEIMRRYSIVLGAVCGARGVEAVNSWHESEPDRVLRGIGPDDPTEFMDPSRFRELVEGGGVDVVCEVGAQYAGYSPSDSAFSPYWAIAQEHGIPVGIHTGSSFPGRPYRGSPNFRLRFGNPLLLEDMLVEYPDLKVYMMHAGGGGPYAEYAFMMMGMYPQLYTDIALLTWLPPPDVLEGFLRDAKRMGLLDRIMFGTDQMTWPEAIGMAVDRINGYDFLSLEEKAGIFYDNAARFLGLSEEVIARHRAMADRNGASR